jgi:hypothetical protein
LGGGIPTGALLLAAACTTVFAIILAAEIQGDLRARQPLAAQGVPSANQPPNESPALAPRPPDKAPSSTPRPKERAGPAPAAPAKAAAREKAASAPQAKAREPLGRPPPTPLALPDALIQAARLGGHSVALDPAALAKAPQTVALRLHSLPSDQATSRVAKTAGLAMVRRDGVLLLTTPERADAAFRDAELWKALPSGDAQVSARLRRTLRLQLVHASHPQALRLLSALLDTPVIADAASLPEPPPRLTLRIDGLPASQALRWVSRLLGVAYVPRDGAVFLATPEAIEDALRRDAAWRPRQQAPTAALAKQMQKRVSISFSDTLLSNALAYLASHTQAPVLLAPRAAARRDARLSFEAHGLELAQALRWTCREAGLTWAWRNSTIRVTMSEPNRR